MNTFKEHKTGLVQGCLRNDRQAQRELFEVYAPRLLGLCRRYTNSREEAEDILMESFMAIFKTLDTFRQECSLETWMYRITVNVAIDHYRKNKKFRIMDSDIDAEINLPNLPDTDDIVTRLEAKQVIEIIEKMPEGLRLIFNLHAVEGFALKDIAKQLDKNENTIRVYYRRARLWLQEQILNEEKETPKRR